MPAVKIDLNSATQQELEKMPGIGPQRARLLLRRRPFSGFDDLKRVPGLNDRIIADMRQKGAAIRSGAKGSPAPRAKTAKAPAVRRTMKTKARAVAPTPARPRKSAVEFGAKRLLATLNNLIQLDYDAIRAYDQAIRMMSSPRISRQLELFKRDHEKHISALTAAVSRLGGKPARNSDVVGFLIQGFTAIGSATGTGGALRAMQSNEMVTNTTYSDALELEMPPKVRRLVKKNYQDEQKHLAWIEKEIRKGAKS
jgi:uncharacterized protein (TIGR02284 family)